MKDCSFVVSLDHQSIDGKRIWKEILQEYGVRVSNEFIFLRHGPMAGSLRMVETGGKAFLDLLSN